MSYLLQVGILSKVFQNCVLVSNEHYDGKWIRTFTKEFTSPFKLVSLLISGQSLTKGR